MFNRQAAKTAKERLFLGGLGDLLKKEYIRSYASGGFQTLCVSFIRPAGANK